LGLLQGPRGGVLHAAPGADADHRRAGQGLPGQSRRQAQRRRTRRRQEGGREAIDAAAADIKDGKDFGEIAAAKSKDAKAAEQGVWPLMPAGSFGEAKVEKAAFAMKEGQVSGVIETDAGFYIVKAYKVQGGKTRASRIPRSRSRRSSASSRKTPSRGSTSRRSSANRR